MTPAVAVPVTEFTPYLLQQTRLRASLLLASFGLASDDWDDLRQDMALDCLRRLPKFDASRGDWKGFVRGVVRNHACVLASRQIRRRALQPLDIDADGETSDDTCDGPIEDPRPALDLSLDTQRVLASLPEEVQRTARFLAEMPISAVCRRTGFSRHKVNLHIGKIRAAFEAAGVTSSIRTHSERKSA
jgi:RNA polymerase sigma-70 factor (ECF subfamily)